MTARDTALAGRESASVLRSLAPAAPYVAVIVGMYTLRSAWASFAIYQVLMVLVLSLARQWHRVPELARSRSRPLFVVAVATPLGGIALYLLAPVLGLTANLAATCARFGITNATWLPFIVCFGLTNPWLEELYWRGYLGSASTTLRWNDVWFGAYHALFLAPFIGWSSLSALVLLIAVGWAWRQTARLSQGLLVPAVSHFCADVSILLAVRALALH